MSELESEEVVSISSKLKAMREQQGLTTAGVAETLNLSEEQIVDLENNIQSLKTLSPFQRGYLRNYANLLGMDMAELESQFPDGMGVGSDLFSVQRYSYKVSKPLMSRGWVKAVMYVVFAVLIAVGIASLDINLDDLKAVTESSSPKQIVLPEIEETSFAAPATPGSTIEPLPELKTPETASSSAAE